MGNGAIIGIPGTPDDPDEVNRENDNIQTVKDYFCSIWGHQNIASLNSFLDPDFRIHRQHHHRDGIAKMAAQIIITQMNFPDITVEIDQMVALRDTVTSHLNIRYSNTAGQTFLIVGLNTCVLEGGLITESSVVYRQPIEAY